MNFGLPIIVSGPAGVGKGTILREAMQKRRDLCYSVSATSRTPRPGETDGENYFFKTRNEFEEMIRNNQLIEWVEYCGNYYGTPREYVDKKRKEGYHVILEIEVEGAMNIKNEYPDGVLVFILPPSFEELKRRIINRGTECQEVIDKRLDRAKEELSFINQYNYYIINDDLENAVDDFNSILRSEVLRVDKSEEKLKNWFK